jgi:hypothetical protein
VFSRLAFGVALFGAVLLLLPAGAQAQGQVTDLDVRQADGYATLSWGTVAGATDYQIERTPVGADGVPTGSAAIVGVWLPNRRVTPDSPRFADAGFDPGERFQWRVRARSGTTEGPFSRERKQAAEFTSDVEEYDYTAALDAASDRVRVVEIGKTRLGRPINMFVIGYPTPPPTVQAVSDDPTALVNCNVHGNEPSSREACLILARELAFGDDPRTLDILSHATVLLVPTINGDGRAANTRGNSTGQDLNRDYC